MGRARDTTQRHAALWTAMLVQLCAVVHAATVTGTFEPVLTNPTNQNNFNLTLTFDGNVNSLLLSEVLVVSNSTQSAEVVYIEETQSRRVWLVAVKTVGEGVVDMGVDIASNTDADAYNAFQMVVDQTSPTLTGVWMNSSHTTPTLASPSHTVTLYFEASEELATPLVWLLGEAASVVASSGNTAFAASVVVTSGSAEGSVAFTVAYEDLASNAGVNATSVTGGSPVVVDVTEPSVSTSAMTSNNTLNTARAKTNDEIALSLSFAEDVEAPTVTIGGEQATVSPATSGTSFTATVVVASSMGEGTAAAVVVSATDLAGNTLSSHTLSPTTEVEVDTTAPSVDSSTLLSSSPASSSLATTGDTLTLVFTVSEALSSATAVVGGASATVVAWDSGLTYNASVVVSDAWSEGSVALSVAIVDATGNEGSLTTTSGDVSVDLTPPTVSSSSVVTDNALDTSYAIDGSTVTATVAVSEPVLSVTATFSGVAGSVSALSSTEYEATVVVSSAQFSDGDITVEVVLEDEVGLSSTTTLPDTVGVDFTAPTASLSTSTSFPSSLESHLYTIVFSETVTGVSAACLGVSDDDGTGARVTAVSPSASSSRAASWEFVVGGFTAAGNYTARVNTTVLQAQVTDLVGIAAEGDATGIVATYTLPTEAPDEEWVVGDFGVSKRGESWAELQWEPTVFVSVFDLETRAGTNDDNNGPEGGWAVVAESLAVTSTNVSSSSSGTVVQYRLVARNSIGKQLGWFEPRVEVVFSPTSAVTSAPNAFIQDATATTITLFHYHAQATHYLVEVHNGTHYEALATNAVATTTVFSAMPGSGEPVTNNTAYTFRIRGRNSVVPASPDSDFPLYSGTGSATIIVAIATELGFENTLSPTVTVTSADWVAGTVGIAMQHTTAERFRVEAWDSDGGEDSDGAWRVISDPLNSPLSPGLPSSVYTVSCVSWREPCPRGDQLQAGVVYPLLVSAGQRSYQGPYGPFQSPAYAAEVNVASAPPAPANARVVAVSPTEVTVAWDVGYPELVGLVTATVAEDTNATTAVLDPSTFVHTLNANNLTTSTSATFSLPAANGTYTLALAAFDNFDQGICETRLLVGGTLQVPESGKGAVFAERWDETTAAGNESHVMRLNMAHPQAEGFKVYLQDETSAYALIMTTSNAVELVECVDGVTPLDNCSRLFDTTSSYHFRVVPFNSVGDGTAMSVIVNATTTTPASAPSPLSPVMFSDTWVMFEWTAVDLANAYHVQYREASSDLQFTTAACGGSIVGTGPFAVHNLDSSTIYEVRVRAVNQHGDGTATTGFNVQPTNAVPSGEAEVLAIIGEDSASMDCYHPHATVCEIQIENVASGVYEAVGTVVSGQTLTFNTLPNGDPLTSYGAATMSLRAVASNNHGSQPESEAVVVVKSLSSLNGPPSNTPPTVKRVALGTTSVTLSMYQETAFLFRIEVKLNDQWQVVATDLQKNTYQITCLVEVEFGGTCSDNSLTSLTTYRFRVTAGNAVGYQSSLYATEITAMPTTSAPGATTNLRISSMTSTSLTATWTDQPDAVYYTVQVREQGAANFTAVAGSSGSVLLDTNQLQITGLSSDKKYELRVVPSLSDGTAGGESEATIITARPSGAAPTSSDASTAYISSIGASSVTLAFSLPVATRFKVQAQHTDGTWFDVQTNIITTTLTIKQLTRLGVSTALTTGSLYSFRVVAGNNHGWQSDSAGVIVQAQPTTLIPQSPVEHLHLQTVSSNAVTLTFDPLPDASEYTVEVAINDSSTYTALRQALQLPTYTANGLMEDWTYTFRITASNQFGSPSGSQLSQLSSTIVAIPTADAPSALIDATVVRSAVYQDSVELQFNHPQASKFRVSWRDPAITNGMFATLYDVAATYKLVTTLNFVTLAPLVEDHELEFDVLPGNSAGFQNATAGARIRVTPSSVAPSPVDSLLPTQFAATSVTIQWNDNPKATYYELHLQTVSINDVYTVGSASVYPTSFALFTTSHVTTVEVGGLLANRTYTVAVLPFNNHNTGDTSGVTSSQAQIVVRPTATAPGDTDTAMLERLALSSSSAELYLFSPLATHYLLYATNASTAMTSIVANTTSVTHTVSLASSTTQTMSVVAVNNHGQQSLYAARTIEVKGTSSAPASAVASLRLHKVTSTSVQLVWDDLADATGYDVYVKPPQTSQYSKSTATPTRNPFDDSEVVVELTGLSLGLQYRVRIVAKNNHGSQTTSLASTLDFITTASAPSATYTTSASVVRFQRTSVSISMQHPQATWYTVMLRETGTTAWSTALHAYPRTGATIDCLDTSFPCTSPLLTSTTYDLLVVPGNRFGFMPTGYGTQLGVAVTTTAPASPVTSIRLSHMSGSTFSLTWDAVSDASYFVVAYRAWTSSPGAYKSLGNVFSNMVSVTPSSSGSYQVQITPANNHGVGDASLAATAIATLTTGVPSAVSDVTAHDIVISGATASLRLQWDAVPTAATYYVDVRAPTGAQDDADSWEQLASTSHTQLDVSGLDVGVVYELRVQGANSNGRDTVGAQTTFKATQDVPSSRVEDLRAVEVGKTSVTVRWDLVVDANKYRVELLDDTNAFVELGTVHTTHFTITGLTTDTDHVVRVTAGNDNGFNEALELATAANTESSLAVDFAAQRGPTDVVVVVVGRDASCDTSMVALATVTDNNSEQPPPVSPTSLAFADEDCGSGTIGGWLSFDRPSFDDEFTVKDYVVYWSDGEGGVVGGVVAEISRPHHLSSPIGIQIPSGTRVQSSGTLAVCASNDYGVMESACGLVVVQDDVRPTRAAGVATASTDRDPRMGGANTTVTFAAAKSESDFEFYDLYLATKTLALLAPSPAVSVPATGASSYTTDFADYVPSSEASTIVVVGRVGLCSATTVSSAVFSDVRTAVPQFSPTAYAFEDTNCNEGTVSASVPVTRAESEVDVTHYTALWATELVTDGSLGTAGEIAVGSTGTAENFTLPVYSASIPTGATHFFVVTSNANGHSASGTLVSVEDAVECPVSAVAGAAPSNAPYNITVLKYDSDCATAFASGMLEVTRGVSELDVANREAGVSSVDCFWASDTDHVGTSPFATLALTDDFTLKSYLSFDSVFIPTAATHIRCHLANENGRSGFVSVAFWDNVAPTAPHSFLESTINDTDATYGVFTAALTLNTTSSESASSFELWWAGADGFPLREDGSFIASLTAGTTLLDASLSSATVPSSNAVMVTALARQGDCLLASGPTVGAVDVATPPSTAVVVDSVQDTNCEAGVATVAVTLSDATGEAVQYEVFWGSASEEMDSIGVLSASALGAETTIGTDVEIPSDATHIHVHALDAYGVYSTTATTAPFTDLQPSTVAALSASASSDTNTTVGGVVAVVSFSGLSAEAGFEYVVLADRASHTIARPTAFRPQQVSNFTAVSAAAGEVTLSWTETTDALGFYVRYRLASSTTWTTLATLPATASQYGITDLDATQAYHFRVDAFNNIGVNEGTSVVVRPTGAPPTSAPADLVLVRIGQTTAVVSWADVDDASSYHVTLRELNEDFSAANSSAVVVAEERALSFINLANLQLAHSYNVSVWARNGQGMGSSFASLIFTTTATSPSPISTIAVSATSPTSFVVSWTPVANDFTVISYVVEYMLKDSEFWNEGAKFVAGTTVGVVEGLLPGSEYSVRLSTENTFGRSATSRVTVVQLATCNATQFGTQCTECSSLTNVGQCALDEDALCEDCAVNAVSTTELSPRGGHVTGGTEVLITVPSDFPISNLAHVRFGRTSGEHRCCPLAPRQALCVTPPAANALQPHGGLSSVELSADATSWHATGALFQYFAPPEPLSIFPATGAAEGGLRVTVSGSGFWNFESGESARCRFGEQEVEAEGTTAGAIVCVTPAFANLTTAEDVVASVSLNGKDFVQVPTAFRAFPTPQLDLVSPQAGPVNGGFAVTLTGSGFDWLAGHSEEAVTCEFGDWGTSRALSWTNTTIVCNSVTTLTANAPVFGNPGEVQVRVALNGRHFTRAYLPYSFYFTTIFSVSPFGVPAGGRSTTVEIHGLGFASYGSVLSTLCRFGTDDATAAESRSDTLVRCAVNTPAEVDLRDALVGVSLAINGQDFVVAPANVTLQYYESPTTSSLSMPGSPLVGGSALEVYGSGFKNFEEGGIGVINCGFGAEDGSVVVSQAILYSNDLMQCEVPSVDAPQQVMVLVALNGVDFSLSGPAFVFYDPPEIATVSDSALLAGYRKDIAVTGTGLDVIGDEALARCRLQGRWRVPVSCSSTDLLRTRCSTCTCADASDEDASTFMPLMFPSASGTAPWVSFDLGSTQEVTRFQTFVSSNSSSPLATVVLESGAGPLDSTRWTTVATHSFGSAGNDPETATDTHAIAAAADGQVLTLRGFSSTARYWRLRVTAVGGDGTFADVATARFFAQTDAVVEGTVTALSPSQLVCQLFPAASAATPEKLLALSLNGEDFALTPFALEVYAPPVLRATFPTGVMATGAATIKLLGSGFDAMLPGDHASAACRFGGDRLGVPSLKSATELHCTTPADFGVEMGASVEVSVYQGDYVLGLTTVDFYPEPSLESVSPTFGAASGDTLVRIVGQGFTAHGTVVGDGQGLCMFRSAADPGQFYTTEVTAIDDALVECVTPRWEFAMANGSVVADVLVTVNGQDYTPSSDYSGTTLTYTFFEDPVIDSIAPEGGPIAGGTVVTLFGGGIQNSTSVECRFGTASDMVVPATYVDDGSMQCTTVESSSGVGSIAVYTSLNGQNYVSTNHTFTFHGEFEASGLSPVGGPTTGGTTVTLGGSGFGVFGAVGVTTCQFGSAGVTFATAVTDTEVVCATPATSDEESVEVSVAMNGQNFQSTGLSFTFYAPVNASSLEPAGGPLAAGFRTTVQGSGMQGHPVDADATCRFVCANSSFVSAGEVLSDEALGCDAPVLSSTTTAVVCALSVALNAQDYSDALSVVLYPHPVLSLVTPEAGLSTHETVANADGSWAFAVVVNGTGFAAMREAGLSAEGLIACRFGDVVTASLYEDDTGVVCEWPTLASAFGEVSVSIALNGANFDDASTATFQYYTAPLFSDMDPQSAPTTQATTVKIFGSGFDAFGNVGTTSCVIGDVTLAATRRTATQVDCLIPEGLVTSTAEDLEVTVALFGEDHVTAFPDPITFGFFAVPEISTVTPTAGALAGGDTITITGSNLLGTQSLEYVLCRIGTFSFAADTASASEITCTTPSGMEPGQFNVSVSLNGGVSWTSSPILFYVRCVDASASRETCVASEQCGLCSDPVTITTTAVTHNTFSQHTVQWHPQADASLYRIRRLALHNSTVTRFQDATVAEGDVGIAERAFAPHPYRRAFVTLNDSLPASTSSFVDETVQHGGRYRYVVSALIGASWIDLLDTVALIPNTISISWEAHELASGYVIQRTSETGNTKTIRVGADEVEFLDSSVTPSTTYEYTVTATVSECQLCADGGCVHGPSDGTCHQWSFKQTLANPSVVGEVMVTDGTLQIGETHFFQVVPPLPSLSLRVFVESTENVRVMGAKGRVPTRASADLVSSRQTSPYTLEVESVSCDGKVVPGEWFDGSVYEPNGCDAWVFAVTNAAYHTDFVKDPRWGNRYALGTSPAHYSIALFYDFVFDNFDCTETEGDCGLLGIVMGGSTNILPTDEEGTEAQGTPSTVRLTSSGTSASVGTVHYGAKLDLVHGFDTTLLFQVTAPSLCVVAREVMDVKRTEDLRKTNFLIDSATSGLAPTTSYSDASNGDFTADAAGMATLPVGGNAVPVTTRSLVGVECTDGGRGKVGGEGFAFVVHNDPRGTSAVGCSGKGVGFAPDDRNGCTDSIANSIIVEFDSYYDVHETNRTFTRQRFPDRHQTQIEFSFHNRISVFVNGTNNHADPLATVSTIQHNHKAINDGLIHSARITYVPTHDSRGMLVVWLDGERVLEVSVPALELGQLDDEGKGFVGMTASTGLASENHDIRAWKLCTRPNCAGVDY